MAKPSGEIIETPITANFREGLTVLQYFISTHGQERGWRIPRSKRQIQDISRAGWWMWPGCGDHGTRLRTMDGIEVTSLVEGGEIIESMRDRILGRVALEDILDPFTGEVIVKANDEIEETLSEKIEDTGIEKVKIRSVLSCKSKWGVCALCYGRDLARGRLVNTGEAIGSSLPNRLESRGRSSP